MTERVISVGNPQVIFDLGREADGSGLGQQDADMGINGVITDAYGIQAWRLGVTEGALVPRLSVNDPKYDFNDQVIVLRPTENPKLRDRDEYRLAMEAIRRRSLAQTGAEE